MVKFQYSDTTTIRTFSLYIMVCFTADFFFSVKFFTFITCVCVCVHCHAQSLIVLLHQSFYDKSLLTLVDTGHLQNAICMFTHLISAKVFYTDVKQNCLKYRLTVLTGHVIWLWLFVEAKILWEILHVSLEKCQVVVPWELFWWLCTCMCYRCCNW